MQEIHERVVPAGAQDLLNAVDKAAFHTFGLPDATITVVRYGESEHLITGELQSTSVIDGELP